MYTIAQNVRIVLSLLKQHGIRHIVINPGATNMPITRGLQNDPYFTCYSIVDERSTIYFAIGMYLELGVPVATTCTSAQATRNYIPGLTEAFYKRVPILAITTSKHPRYTCQEYMQGPDQTSLPADAVKKSFALPYISNHHDELYCTRLANEAILELTHRTPGPIQLNLPILGEDMGIFSEPNLPDVRLIKRYMQWNEWDTPLKGKKILIVVGEHRPFTKIQADTLNKFADTHNVAIYVNHLSNYHGKYVVSANLSLASMGSDMFKSTYKPEILITIGGQTGDYPLFNKLAAGNESDFEHWRVSEDGMIVDTYDKLTKVFECPFEHFFSRLAGTDSVPHTYFNLWYELQSSMQFPDELPFSNAFLAQHLHNSIPKNSYLNLAILNSLRIWSFFPLSDTITCYSNVAAFGIDGCLSVLLGQSVTTDKLCFIVIGDLSFFYDMNGLSIRHLKDNIRILLVNNNGGTEFKLYSHPAHQFGKESDAFIAASGHKGSVKGWAEACGFKYLSATNKKEFLQQKNQFVSESKQSIIFEVFTNHQDESDALKILLEKNKLLSGADMVKSKVRSIIGKKGIEVLKNIIK
ncbi:MAG: 2-succinyl-5-enolpyruvyl-6-hydroxy-3-cyclohexene-1-carboxylate synthase [Crenarchaeota archaeon]|nr:2-succinyl-5-enolpyruvyl-6-hydroxy-3-cyclohexene-1-carboxylate synthase [Thermoproteota archaeon]